MQRVYRRMQPVNAAARSRSCLRYREALGCPSHPGANRVSYFFLRISEELIMYMQMCTWLKKMFFLTLRIR